MITLWTRRCIRDERGDLTGKNEEQRTGGRICVLPHIIPAQHVVNFLPFHMCTRGHLVQMSAHNHHLTPVKQPYLLRDWEFIGTRITCPFVVSCIRGDDQHVRARRTEQH